jgi:hypothetical protein
MAMAKGMIVCLWMIILFGLLVEDTNAKRFISKGAMQEGARPCQPAHSMKCLFPPPQDHYTLPCRRMDGCGYSPPKRKV